MNAADDTPLASTATVSTASASRYLQQLCKHFAHKLQVDFTPQAGRIAFSSGTCDLAADGANLTMIVRAAGAEELARLQDVIARHLERFAFREPPRIEWSGPSA